jgi:hypothetical protein
MEIVPALGAIFNAPVFLWASGNPQPLGNVLTDGTTGKATISFDAPASGSAFFSRCTVGPGSSYFDEGIGRVIQVGPSAAPVELFAVKTSTTAPMAISPLTNMVAKLAGVDSASISSPTFSLTNDKIVNAISTVIAVLGLPANFDIISAPIAATASNPNPNSAYGLLLSEMAKVASASGGNALTQATALVSAVSSNGTVVSANTLVSLNAGLIKSGKLNVQNAAEVINNPTKLAERVNEVKSVVQSTINAPTSTPLPTAAPTAAPTSAPITAPTAAPTSKPITAPTTAPASADTVAPASGSGSGSGSGSQ